MLNNRLTISVVHKTCQRHWIGLVWFGINRILNTHALYLCIMYMLGCMYVPNSIWTQKKPDDFSIVLCIVSKAFILFTSVLFLGLMLLWDQYYAYRMHAYLLRKMCFGDWRFSAIALIWMEWFGPNVSNRYGRAAVITFLIA